MEIPVSALAAAASGPPTCEVIVINKPAAHLIEVGIFYEITIIRTSMVYGGHLGHVRGSGQLTPVVPQFHIHTCFLSISICPPAECCSLFQPPWYKAGYTLPPPFYNLKSTQQMSF